METDEKGLVKCPYRREDTVSGIFLAWAGGTLVQHQTDIEIVLYATAELPPGLPDIVVINPLYSIVVNGSFIAGASAMKQAILTALKAEVK